MERRLPAGILQNAGWKPALHNSSIIHPMKIRFDMIGLFVTDLPRMVAFYRDVVDLEVQTEVAGEYAEFHHEGIRFSMCVREKVPDLLGQAPGYPDGLNGTF